MTSAAWYKAQSDNPIAYTPFGTYGKRSVEAVCALHWPTDHDMMRQRMSHLIAGQTVDESTTHLIIDRAVCKHTGTSVTGVLAGAREGKRKASMEEVSDLTGL